jgi:hypothetical protein
MVLLINQRMKPMKPNPADETDKTHQKTIGYIGSIG